MTTYRYVARGGRVYVREGGTERETATAVTAKGRDLERFEAALQRAQAQKGSVRKP